MWNHKTKHRSRHGYSCPYITAPIVRAADGLGYWVAFSYFIPQILRTARTVTFFLLYRSKIKLKLNIGIDALMRGQMVWRFLVLESNVSRLWSTQPHNQYRWNLQTFRIQLINSFNKNDLTMNTSRVGWFSLLEINFLAQTCYFYCKFAWKYFVFKIHEKCKSCARTLINMQFEWDYETKVQVTQQWLNENGANKKYSVVKNVQEK